MDMKNLKEILSKDIVSKNNEIFGSVILHKNTLKNNPIKIP